MTMSDDPVLVTPPQETVRGTLALFGRQDWFSEPGKSSIWLRIHTAIGLPKEDAAKRLKGFVRDLKLDGPVAFQVGYIGDLKLIDFDHEYYASDDGQLVAQMHGRDRLLPNSLYATLATPHRIDGAVGREGAARDRLSRASALLVLHAGFNLLRNKLFDGEVNMATGQFTISGRVFKTPQPADGPFFYADTPLAIPEICDALGTAHREIRQRINLALSFFERAIREDDQFFYYWTALELLCNGKAQRIRSRLQACYHVKSVKQVDEELGFAVVARWRHDYFHKGTSPTISADVERYLQLMFLELLRFELGLSRKGYLVGMLRSDGFDLSSIGLADRRTPEQLEAIRRSHEMLEAARDAESKTASP